MNKKIKKMFAAVSAVVMCAVSTTSFVSAGSYISPDVSNISDDGSLKLYPDNVTPPDWFVSNDWIWRPTFENVTPYTTAFTTNTGKRYVLCKELTDYLYNLYEEPKTFEDNGQLLTAYGFTVNVYKPENSNGWTYGLFMTYYKNESGKIGCSSQLAPLVMNDCFVLEHEEAEILEQYLIDNNISYDIEEHMVQKHIYIHGDEDEQLEVYNDVKEKFGFKVDGCGLESGEVNIEFVENSFPEPKKTLDGDANNDGQLTIADAAAIVQFIGNTDKYPLSEQGKINADCYNSGDGVTGKDAVAIQMIEAGLINSFDEIENI